MSDLETLSVRQQSPAQYPERIQLYSLPTPNGVKASIMLEESGLKYEPHWVSFDSNDQKSKEFLAVNPNGKIPRSIRTVPRASPGHCSSREQF